MWFITPDKMHLLTPRENMSTYTFNKHVIKHHFCKICGMHPFGEGVSPQGNQMVAINLRCVEDISLDSIPVTHFDGKSL
ncbi:hypothetical protein [Uliginosibacterium sediminicola]|uniref:CENP-V/GFA domain-containing protein n=1 Tax=Uliginosibacterium sediminicola TaxID=2024550 RepID=A0ABU9YUF3_9RHOO